MNDNSTRPLTVIRYLSKSQYVDDFFNNGMIWLSSFRAFRNLEDEQRRDPAEGWVYMEINNPNAHGAICVLNAQPAYILSTVLEGTNTEGSFKNSSGFRITNTLAFADCISHKIPGLIDHKQGLCSYRNSTVIRKQLDVPFKPPDSHTNPEEYFAEFQKFIASQIADSDAFSLKSSKYTVESEYRFIWWAQGEQKEDYKQLYCPEAVKFCERIS
jgi:hypothetical protein